MLTRSYFVVEEVLKRTPGKKAFENIGSKFIDFPAIDIFLLYSLAVCLTLYTNFTHSPPVTHPFLRSHGAIMLRPDAVTWTTALLLIGCLVQS